MVYQGGETPLRKSLAEIPSDLSEMFKGLLRRNNGNIEALRLCILWILYARRPLQPMEFYHALWSGLLLEDLIDSQIPDVTFPENGDSLIKFNRYIISSSKGVAEITKSKHSTVQFIHEYVRDSFVKDKGSQDYG